MQVENIKCCKIASLQIRFSLKMQCNKCVIRSQQIEIDINLFNNLRDCISRLLEFLEVLSMDFQYGIRNHLQLLRNSHSNSDNWLRFVY